MNRLFMRSLLTILLCFGSTFVFADEEVPFPEVIRVEDQEEEDVPALTPFTESFIGNHDDSHYLKRIHNDGYYHLVATSDTGSKVQLHDASKWAVERSGQAKVLQWVESDDIFIKPSAACFSYYAYVLHNRTVNQAVAVNLVQPPLPMGAFTFRIMNIEPHQRLVLLSDHTIWKVENSYAFSKWQVGQRVLVGVNNKWRTALFPHIFINIDIPGEPYSQTSFYGYPAN